MTPEAPELRDNARKPLRFVLFWGIPIVALIAVDSLTTTPAIRAGVVLAAFAWIGVACLVNALQCGRVHCWFTGPWCLLIALLGFAVAFLGLKIPALTFSRLVNVGTLGAVALWLVPEMIAGKYFPRGDGT